MTVPLLTMSVPFALVELPTIRRLLLTANVPPATTIVAVLPLPLAIHVCIVGTIIEPPLVRIVVPALNRFCMVERGASGYTGVGGVLCRAPLACRVLEDGEVIMGGGHARLRSMGGWNRPAAEPPPALTPDGTQ